LSDKSPQLEDGFTRIANELFEAMILKAPCRIPSMFLIFMAVMRDTYGFGRKKAEISTERFKKLTGIDKRQNIYKAVKEAVEANLICVIGSDYKKNPTYSIQKHYSKWCSVIGSDTRNRKRLQMVSEAITSVIGSDTPLYVKETSKETIKETHPSLSSQKPEQKNGNIPYDGIKELWNSIMEETELSTIDGLSETRKKHLKARWNYSDKTKSLEWWETYFNFITESDFLMGRAPVHTGKRAWKASFDWVINESNFLKIKEGNYN
jgi:phage replication O-like protein O